MKRIFRAFSAALAALSLFAMGFCAYSAQTTPDEITICKNGGYSFGDNSAYTLCFTESTGAYGTSDRLNTKAEIKLFGLLPVKSVDVHLSDRQTVTLGGKPFGIRLYTDGLVVAKTSSVPVEGGSSDPSSKAGIRCGDIILEANGEALKTNEQLTQICEKSGGSPILLRCRRNGDYFSTTIIPEMDVQLGSYRLGLWVRDSCAGIGTITFTDENTKTFAGLGHGIYDGDSGSLMPLADGDIVPADIISADKSIGGSPGSLCGCFTSGEPLGRLRANSECGLYGTYSDISPGKEIEIAFRQEVTKGSASMLSTIEGSEPECYDVEIEDISYDNSTPSKNMVIRITDKRLIEKTGGIVRGMSGSPIIQNGRLVGALTHVYIDDPVHGYAVFAENMADYNNKIVQKQAAITQ